MKKIKYLFWLIILAALGILIYQNLEYFMAVTSLKFDLKISGWSWVTPELQNIVLMGICFAIGLIVTGIKWLAASLRLKKEIKTKDAKIASLKEQLRKSSAPSVYSQNTALDKTPEEKDREADTTTESAPAEA